MTGRSETGTFRVMGEANGKLKGVGSGNNPASARTRFQKGVNPRLPKRGLFDTDSVDWKLMLDFEWAIQFPCGVADTGIRKHLQSWMKRDPVEFTKEYGKLLTRLKPPNVYEAKALEERVADESEDRVLETVGEIVKVLRGRVATVATGG